MRVESCKPAKNGGWLHILRNDRAGATWTRTFHVAARKLEPETSGIDFGKLAAEAAASTPDELLERFGKALGVSADSLRLLGVGWMAERKAWGFPMRNAAGDVIGIRLRYRSGAKAAIKGSKQGLFFPANLGAYGRLYLPEGPTDAAALLTLGLPSLGRPSCSGGVSLVLDYVKRQTPIEAIVVADADAVGQRGADTLAMKLRAYVAQVKVITPPAKDAREWVRSGATPADVNTLISATPAKSLKIRVSTSNKMASLALGARG
jgi:hypothetical protein